MSTNQIDQPSPPKKVTLPQRACVRIAKDLIEEHEKVLDENIALNLIDKLVNTRETLEKFYELGLASDGKYFIDPSSRVEIMYMILGESLGSSSPSTIQIMLVGYSNANVKVIERISKCLQEARNTYQNLQ